MADLDKLITRVTSITELKQLLTEIEINNTDKISKISDESVLNAFNYAIAKVAQKQLKDIAIVESLIFPESSSGEYLDRSASMFGGLTRLGTAGSSTFVRVKATDGTSYVPGVHIFTSNTGIQFEVSVVTTVGSNGFAYVPVRSINVGELANVPPQTINTVTPRPVGHESCTNEYMAVGGRDAESDESFKIRIRAYPNYVAQATVSKVLEVIRRFNPNVLRLFNVGMADDKIDLRLVLENGSYLTDSELDELLAQCLPYLSLVDSNRQGLYAGVELLNVAWRYIDMDFRVGIGSGYVEADVRKAIQISISKYLDFRYWAEQRTVQWDDMLQIVKSVAGVTYVPDEYFVPGTDVQVFLGELPRVRGFIMRNLDGTILFDSSNSLTPVFYENGI